MQKCIQRNRTAMPIILMLISLMTFPAQAVPGDKNDVHYNAAGFFDVHVCNWPGRKLFFLALFSSFQYDLVKSVTVYRSNGSTLGVLDLSRYRVIRKKGKPEKRVFISEFEVSVKDRDGWYSAVVEFKDGKQFRARDFVTLNKLGMAETVFPKHNESLPEPPTYLEWKAIPDAGFYKVFIRDMWDENKLIHKSKLVKTNRYRLPKALLKPGGLYSWKIHARDVNEDLKLGDFGRGSLSNEAEFIVK